MSDEVLRIYWCPNHGFIEFEDTIRERFCKKCQPEEVWVESFWLEPDGTVVATDPDETLIVFDNIFDFISFAKRFVEAIKILKEREAKK